MQASNIGAGVKNVSDHGTIGPRNFFGMTENIQDSVTQKENVKQTSTNFEIEGCKWLYIPDLIFIVHIYIYIYYCFSVTKSTEIPCQATHGGWVTIHFSARLEFAASEFGNRCASA